MSLFVCPIQEVCPKYENGTINKEHFVRLTHPCNQFLAMCCETAVQLEMFLTNEPMACNIEKIHRLKSEL